MRQVEKRMVAAIKARTPMNCGNTSVTVKDDYCDVLLFGNHIARVFNDGRGEFTLSGWDTNTTRSRLNALGVGVYREKRMTKYNGMIILSDQWYGFEFNK